MSECDICKIYDAKESFKIIYEDELCFAMIHEAPANQGHALVIPKTHYPIFEEVPDNILERCFLVANKISVAVFETLGAHGTNILVNNGPTANQTQPHFMINVIPRYENDGINFDWEMKQADSKELELSKDLITRATDKVFFGGDDSPMEEIKLDKIDSSDDKNAFMIEQLRRIP